MKELIEQIGGRERLEAMAEGNWPDSGFYDNIKLMARALLAVLDSKPVGTVSIAMDWSTHRNIATVNMRPDLVLSEMRDGDNVYTRPPAASAPDQSAADSVPDGWKLVPIEPTEDMIISGFESRPDEFWSKPEEWEAYEEMSGCQQAAHKARLCYAAMLASAPAPGDLNG